MVDIISYFLIISIYNSVQKIRQPFHFYSVIWPFDICMVSFDPGPSCIVLKKSIIN